MGSKNRYDGVLSTYAIHLIKNFALSVCSAKGFSSSDQEDIEQELVIRLLARLPHYNEEKASLDTFLHRVVVRLASDLVRSRQAIKRGVDVTVHLEDPVCSPTEEEACTLLDLLDPSECGTLGGAAPRTEEERIQLQIDTERLIQSLPADLRELCYLLQEESVAEIAASLGRHRTTVYKRVQSVRTHLQKRQVDDPRET